MATAKKSATPKRTSRKPKASKAEGMRSFRPYPEELPFFHMHLTRQTVYWLAISLLVLSIGAWVVYLSVTTQNIYDQVEMLTNS